MSGRVHELHVAELDGTARARIDAGRPRTAAVAVVEAHVCFTPLTVQNSARYLQLLTPIIRIVKV